MINYQELQKSGLVLYDIAALYLPLYDRPWKDFFQVFAPLAVVEGLIYQVEIAIDNGHPISWAVQEAQIVAFLQAQQLMSPQAQNYLDEVGQYFALVQQLKDLTSFQKLSGFTPAPQLETNLVRVVELRPSDMRLLHTLAIQLLDQPYDEELFALLCPLENLLELKANLTEYETDVATGHYNSYDMVVKLYGEKSINFVETEQARYHAMLQALEATATAANRHRYHAMRQRYEEAYSTLVPIPPVNSTADVLKD